MEERDKPQEEEYSFLQETIKDEAGGRKKLKKDILRIIGFGFIFGIVACFSFCAFKPWIETHFESDPEKVTIPKDEEEDEEETKDPEEKKQQSLDTDSYRQMLQSLSAVATETNKSMVEITGLTGEEDWTKGQDISKQSVSGVIVADNGQELLILGKKSAKKGTKQIRVTFSDGESCEATKKSEDNNLGFCIYAVAREGIKTSTWKQIETATLGNSNITKMGDTAIVLGKPFGYANAVGYGVVATNENHVEMADGQYSLIYTDVAGSSEGSGIIANIRGEIIGIIDQSVLDEDNRNLIAGYGISDIKGMIELLSNGSGVPYVGINGVDITEEMQEKGLPKGVYVKGTEADSPAMAAGIQSGDIITSIDGNEVTAFLGYHNILMKQSPGKNIVLKGCRQGAGGEYVDIDFYVTVGTKE